MSLDEEEASDPTDVEIAAVAESNPDSVAVFAWVLDSFRAISQSTSSKNFVSREHYQSSLVRNGDPAS